jgi:hypothetical protein
MPSLSGSTQSQLVAALRYLALITPTSSPTENLVTLAQASPQEYQKLLRELLISSYGFLFDGRQLKKITAQEMKNRFAAAGASKDAIRKGVAFFLAAARHCQIPLPPFIAPTRMQGKLRAAKPRGESPDSPRTAGEQTVNSAITALLSKFPDFDPAWSPEIKAKWFEAFGRLMEQVNPKDETG